MNCGHTSWQLYGDFNDSYIYFSAHFCHCQMIIPCYSIQFCVVIVVKHTFLVDRFRCSGCREMPRCTENWRVSSVGGFKMLQDASRSGNYHLLLCTANICCETLMDVLKAKVIFDLCVHLWVIFKDDFWRLELLTIQKHSRHSDYENKRLSEEFSMIVIFRFLDVCKFNNFSGITWGWD